MDNERAICAETRTLPPKALGYLDLTDSVFVFERKNELYAEDRTCDECGHEIAGLHNCTAVYVNRTGTWFLVHHRCAMEVCMRENAAIQQRRSA